MSTLVCDICGGALNMESNGEFAVCDSCGLRHSKERLKVKAQEINGVVEITKGEVEKERLLSNAETFLEFGDISKANNLFIQITNEYPDDYRGWFGAFRCKFEYKCITVQDLIEAQVYEDRMVKLGYSQITDEFWDDLFKEKENFNIIERSHTEYKDIYSIIDDFSAELICYETKKLPPRLKKLQLIVGENYANKFLNGDVLTFTTDKYNRCRGFWGEYLGFSTFGDSLKESDVLSQLFNKGIENAQKVEEMPKIERKEYLNSIGVYSNVENIKVKFILGKSLVYLDFDDIQSYELREINEVVTLDSINNFINGATMKIYQFKGVCQHCGGSFTGFFKKKCSKCGKEKDY